MSKNNIIDSVIEEIVEFLEFGPGEESYIREKFDKTIKAVLKDVELEEKEKHSDFKDVYDEWSPTKYLVDCSWTEAECYNQAVSDQKKAHKKYEQNSTMREIKELRENTGELKALVNRYKGVI